MYRRGRARACTFPFDAKQLQFPRALTLSPLQQLQIRECTFIYVSAAAFNRPSPYTFTPAAAIDHPRSSSFAAAAVI